MLIGYLTEMSKFKNIILLVDWSDIYTLDEPIIEHYLQLLQTTSLHFQTILASHTRWEKLEWKGWSAITLTKEKNVDIKWLNFNNLKSWIWNRIR